MEFIVYVSLQDTASTGVSTSGSLETASPATLPPLEASDSLPATVPVSMETDEEPQPDAPDSSTPPPTPVEGSQDQSSVAKAAGTTEEKVEKPNIKPRDLFATIAQERILGLIGALLPINRQVICYFSFIFFLFPLLSFYI